MGNPEGRVPTGRLRGGRIILKLVVKWIGFCWLSMGVGIAQSV
jgi:hypothetical protein